MSIWKPPEKIDSILSDILSERGYLTICKEYDVVSRWKEVVGERISSVTECIRVENSHGWSLERMPAVDRAILRLGAYEVLYAEDVPEPVAISEAVALATELSTDESPRFVNGVLGRLLEVKPTLL